VLTELINSRMVKTIQKRWGYGKCKDEVLGELSANRKLADYFRVARDSARIRFVELFRRLVRISMTDQVQQQGRRSA
jgi:hypothetical protein